MGLGTVNQWFEENHDKTKQYIYDPRETKNMGHKIGGMIMKHLPPFRVGGYRRYRRTAELTGDQADGLLVITPDHQVVG